MMIAVLGAGGFVGSALTRALVARGEPVRILVRDEDKALARLGVTPGVAPHERPVEVVRGDMHDAAALDRLLAGARAVHVLVQTVTSPQARAGGDGFAAAERRALEGVVRAARRSGTTRLLTVGLLGTTAGAPNAWVRARVGNDAYLLGSGLDVTVLRPGLVVGAGSVGFDGIAAAARRRVAAINGGGHQRWSHIALDDLVGYLVDALDTPATHGRAYDVGSTQAPTYRELVRRTAAVLGRPAPTLVPVPLRALALLAPLVERRRGLPPGGIRAAVHHLGDDLVGDPLPIRAVLPRPLTGYEDAARRALGLAAPGTTPASCG